MSSKNILPNELLIKLFSLVDSKDRQAIDLACKRFNVITTKYESKMKHQVYSDLYIRFFFNQDNKFADVYLNYEENLAKEIKGSVKAVNSKEELYINMSKVVFNNNSIIRVSFSSYSQDLYDFKDSLQTSHKLRKIHFHYEGKGEFLHFDLLCNGWAKELEVMEICAGSSSFKSFASNPAIKLHDSINLVFQTDSQVGNYDPFLWNAYLDNNKFNSIDFKCNEDVSTENLYYFIGLFFIKIVTRRIGEIRIILNANHYRKCMVEDLNERLVAQNCRVHRFNDSLSNVYTCVYSRSIGRTEDGKFISETVALDFEGEFEEEYQEQYDDENREGY
uniref:F-box domain-containing protein n=1 Tax=Rhabditophanes sp. KR3021 TaxID=114890 RepID=A0AC35UBI7_9BILA